MYKEAIWVCTDVLLPMTASLESPPFKSLCKLISYVSILSTNGCVNVTVQESYWWKEKVNNNLFDEHVFFFISTISLNGYEVDCHLSIFKEIKS